jgi:glutamate-1-semialdehyde 2,1-aminomutase
MAAIIGRSDIMQAAQLTFISSTYWTERIGPVAALATIRKHERCQVTQHLIRMGEWVQTGWGIAATRAGLPIHIGGIKPLSHFTFEGEMAQAAHTLFTQLMLEHGFLAGKAFYATYAHQDEHIENYLGAVETTFGLIAQALEQGTVLELLKGPVAHTGFRRLN